MHESLRPSASSACPSLPASRGPLPPYTRRVLVDQSALEVLLATWREGGRTAPHDHGGAGGRVLLLRGRFREERFVRRGGDLVCIATRVYVAPTWLTVRPETIHAMTALTPRAESLHLYAPGGAAMRVYDEAKGRVLTLLEGSGAWLPDDATRVLHAESFRCTT